MRCSPLRGNNLTRLLLKSLRHDPGLLGITLDADGWSNVVDVANCVELRFGEVAIEKLKASIALLVQSERIEICGSKIPRLVSMSHSCRIFDGVLIDVISR